jgi:AcrR family transcriptional regulator
MKRRSAVAPMRERILDEVERLIACKGVYGFRLRDVAEPLGVQVPAIYKHYKSRDDVLVVVSRRFIALLAEQFQAPTELAPRAALRFAAQPLRGTQNTPSRLHTFGVGGFRDAGRRYGLREAGLHACAPARAAQRWLWDLASRWLAIRR